MNQTLWVFDANYDIWGFISLRSKRFTLNKFGFGLSLVALNATTGDLVWNYTGLTWIASTPAVVYGIVYFGSFDKNVYALNATTGQKIWNYTTGVS